MWEFVMQRYFFDLAQEAYPADLQGMEFPSVAEAQAEASRFANEVYGARPELTSSTGELHIEVTDSNRYILFTLVATGVVASQVGSSAALPIT